MDTFTTDFMTRLDGKLSASDLALVKSELELFCGNYDISERVTAVVPYEDVFPNAYRAYMVTKKIEGRSMGTLDQYKRRLEEMFMAINKPLEEITTNDIRLFLYTIKEQRNISDHTLDNTRLILNSFFSWCSQEEYCTKNVCASIAPIKYERKEREAFSDVEIERLRDGCITLRDKAIVEVFYATGCRLMELTELKKKDIDLATREVHLFGKGKKHRTSYINAKAGVALTKYLNSREDTEEWLFVGERKPHNKLSRRSVEKILENIGDRANIKGVYPHRMRHTMATTALNHGMPITDLQVLLGHNKLDTTMIYAKTNQTNVAYNYSKSIV